MAHAILKTTVPGSSLFQRSGDGEPVYVAGARVSPDGAEAVIELFVRPGFLNVALAEHEAKALAKALKSGTDYSGDMVRYQRGKAVSELAFGGGYSAWMSDNDAERLAERLDWFCGCVLDDLRREKG